MSKTDLGESAKWLQFRDKWVSKQPALVCAYCGRSDLVSDAPIKPRGAKSHVFNRVKGLDPKQVVTVDHIHPQSKGGGKFDEANFAVCCTDCNQLKKDYTIDEWITQMQNIIDYVAKNKKQSIISKIKNLF